MFNSKEEIYYSVILVGVFAFCLILIIIVTAVLYHRRKVTHNEERARLKEELLHTQIEIQEQTLRTISQEIHDNIGQTLSLARLTLNMMDLEQEASLDKIFHSQELVGKAIQDLRSLSKTLNTDSILSAGLLKAITYELEMIAKSGALKTELKITGDPYSLPTKKELILFRIAQEALNNALKHAGATVILIEIGFDCNRLSLQIVDDGKGFDVTQKENEMDAGSGMKNMQTRAQLMGGNLAVVSGLKGTIIKVTVPTN